MITLRQITVKLLLQSLHLQFNMYTMRNIFTLLICCLLFNSCDVLQDVANATADSLQEGNKKTKLSESDVVNGLKEALKVGTQNAVNISSITDGFNKNNTIRLPFPEDAIKVKEQARTLGFTKQVEKFEETLNRAAEEAVKEATPIFVDAITNMTINDAWGILKGDSIAATTYLKNTTNNALYTAFKPSVNEAIQKVELTKYWYPIITKYNQVAKLTGKEELNPDLEDYVTERTIEGLFILIAKEEQKIRKDPTARISDILAKVFEAQDN